MLRDGWYVTGDIATIDEDGFIRITDRLSRFSKIAGEMVPHMKVEEAAPGAAARSRTSASSPPSPDAAKGERLVALLHRSRGHGAGDLGAAVDDLDPEALDAEAGGSPLRRRDPDARHRQGRFCDSVRDMRRSRGPNRPRYAGSVSGPKCSS